jgi:hypothetical protein
MWPFLHDHTTAPVEPTWFMVRSTLPQSGQAFTGPGSASASALAGRSPGLFSDMPTTGPFQAEPAYTTTIPSEPPRTRDNSQDTRKKRFTFMPTAETWHTAHPPARTLKRRKPRQASAGAFRVTRSDPRA